MVGWNVIHRLYAYITGTETTSFDPENQDEDQENQEETGHETTLFHRSNPLFADDRASRDLMLAVEQMILAKRLSDRNAVEKENRLNDLEDTVETITRDLSCTSASLTEKDELIKSLKEKLTDKNIQIDELLESCRHLQSEMADSVDQMKDSMETERKKYVGMYVQAQQDNAEALKTVKDKGQVISGLKAENESLRGQLARVRHENRYLMDIVKDFTDQLSVSFPRHPDDETEDTDHAPGKGENHNGVQ